MIDFLVIGGGPGGTPLAMVLAQAGRSVGLVESGPGLGGTCLFEGCIPSKIFREVARRLRELRDDKLFGLQLPALDADVDWPAVLARKHEILGRRSDAALARARSLPQLEVINGRARFTSPRAAEVALTDGGLRTIKFRQAVIATGSVSFLPPIPGVDHARVLDSEAILSIEEIPENLLVIGGGPIGVELGQVFRTLGSQVTILEAAPRILGPVDAELAKQLATRMQEDGIEVLTGCRIRDIAEAGNDRLQVNYYVGENTLQQRSADTLLLVTGRRPRVEGLGLENTAVAHGPHGIEVNGQLETTEPGLFAVGDVAGAPMFAHWATAQGLALAAHLLGRPARFPRPEHNSAVIFSEPELGIAGLTEEQAREQGIDAAVAYYDFSGDARAQIAGDARGTLKIVYDRSDRRIVGVHVLAEGAGDLIGEAAVLVRAGISIDILASSIHPHPTLTESFGLAARAALAAARREENA